MNDPVVSVLLIVAAIAVLTTYVSAVLIYRSNSPRWDTCRRCKKVFMNWSPKYSKGECQECNDLAGRMGLTGEPLSGTHLGLLKQSPASKFGKN